MKKGIAVFMAALVISCSAVCVSCTEREVTGTVSVADDVYEMPDTDALKKNEGVMVTFTRTPGGDMPSFSADAYDTSGAHYHLNLPNGDSLKEYSEVYTLVRSYFE